MRIRTLAASSAIFVAAGALAPATALADTPTTVYVNNSNGACSDSAGLGTAAVPFCTIQAAVNTAKAGQTVLISAGTYAPFTVTSSGTATAPITIAGPAPTRGPATGTVFVTSAGATPAVALSGAAYVDVTAIRATGNSAQPAVQVTGSNNVTLDTMLDEGLGSAPAVQVTGGSSHVTISRNDAQATNSTTGIVSVSGGTADTITTNDIVTDQRSPGIVLDGTTDSAITGNTVGNACGQEVSVTDGSTATTIENNQLPAPNDAAINSSCATTAAAASSLLVDESSASGTTADFNDAITTATSTTAYSWSGSPYSTAAALTQAVGQGAHDWNTTANSSGVQTSIDSANSDAPGELGTDLFGHPRVDDPLVSNTGAGTHAYYDRGATELQDPLTVFPLPGTTEAPVGGQAILTATVHDIWTNSLSCTFNFGDGTSPVTIADVDGGCTTTHPYSATGEYYPTLTVTSSLGPVETSNMQLITVVPPAPFVADLSLSPFGALGVTAGSADTSDSWNITSYSFDFGDNTGPTVTTNGVANHLYSAPGTYTVTETVTDADGNSKQVTKNVSTQGADYTPYGPTRILDTRIGTGAPQAQLAPNQTIKLKVEGNGTIPATGVAAVVLNLTATDTNGTGFVSGYADGATLPNVSNLNYSPNHTVANLAVVPVGSDGSIDLTNSGSLAGNIDLLADVTGYFTQAQTSEYAPLSAPARLLDTRAGTGTNGKVAKVAPDKPLVLTIDGADSGALPDSGITAVALTVTATDTAGTGFVSVYPDQQGTPVASSLNYTPNQTLANSVIVPVGPDGKIDLLDSGATAGTVDLIADVTGYYGSDPAATGIYVPIAPERLFDTRTTGSPLQPNEPYGASLGGPTITAVVANLTVTDTHGAGFLTAYPASGTLPDASNLNYTPNVTVASLAQVTPGTDSNGDVLFDDQGATAGPVDLIVDEFGYYATS